MCRKIMDRIEAARRAALERAKGNTVVFTNGCFDILHVGHVRYLATARAQGDLLVVGLNSDRSVREIKGPRRPVNSQEDRAEVLAALECVDVVCVFDEPDPGDLIAEVLPNVLVKGADWAEEDIIGGDTVKAHGGRVVRVPVVPGASTTATIERILENRGDGK
ncbi:MAG: D-glycero-beta-D-manno-heptose 1-phosphate adenylyltransferase [Desulfatibacillaceae bacterium]